MNLADYIAGCARTARQVQIEQAAAPRPLRDANPLNLGSDERRFRVVKLG